MTQQYLVGELSLLLGQLQSVTMNQASAREVAGLRYEAETRALAVLASVTARALALTDGLCWESLTRSDAAMFNRQASLSAELHDFGVCAGLLDDE